MSDDDTRKWFAGDMGGEWFARTEQQQNDDCSGGRYIASGV